MKLVKDAPAADVPGAGVPAWRRLWLAAICLLAAAGLLAIFRVPAAPYTFPVHSFTDLLIDGDTWLLFDGEDPVRLDGHAEIFVNDARTALIYLTEDKELYSLAAGGKPALLAERVAGTPVLYGDTALYYTRDAAGAHSGLYRHVIGEEAKLLANGASLLAASPRGKQIVYSADGDIYRYGGGSAVMLDLPDGLTVCFISDDSRYLYYYEKDATELRLQKSGRDMAGYGGETQIIGINRAGNEVLYRKGRGDETGIYLSLEGGAGVRLLGGDGRLLLPEELLEEPRTLIGGLFQSGEDLYRIGETAEKTVRLAATVDPSPHSGDHPGAAAYENIATARDGGAAVYTASGKLCRLTDASGTGNETVLVDDRTLAAGVSLSRAAGKLAFTRDLRQICFIDGEGRVYHIDGTRAPQHISDGADAVYAGFTYGVFYVVRHSVLYTSVDGGPLKRVPGIEGDVIGFTAKETHAVLTTTAGYYRSTGAASFHRFAGR